MGFFRSLVAPRPSAPPPKPSGAPAAPPRFSFEGLGEREAVLLHSSSKVKTLGRNEVLFKCAENNNFFVVANGAVDVCIETSTGRSFPVLYSTGDCITPMPASAGAQYVAESRETSTLLEITPAALRTLPDKAQLWLFQNANKSAGRAHRAVAQWGMDRERKTSALTVFIENELARTRNVVYSDLVQDFIQRTPRLPVFTLDLAAKLLDERTSVQDVVENIKRDSALAAAVLRVVNSCAYGFTNKIENFYHACVVLGFDNIYQLVLRDALRHVVPINAESKIVHAHSCIVSALTYETAMSTGGKVHPQTAMTYGLLHEIGWSVVWLMKQEKAAAPEFLSLLDTGKLGSDLLNHWGLPERICRVVELQRYPEFAAPDTVQSEFGKELGVLHLAHLFEALLRGETLEPGSLIHAPAYMALIGIKNATPEEYFKTTIVPALSRNKPRYGREVQQAITSYEERTNEKPADLPPAKERP